VPQGSTPVVRPVSARTLQIAVAACS
jgi:hypothetical protein